MATENNKTWATHTWSYEDYYTERKKRQGAHQELFETIAAAREALANTYKKKLTKAAVKASIEEVQKIFQTTSAMEKLRGYRKVIEVKLSDKASEDEAWEENVDALVAADTVASYPPCREGGLLEGVQLGEYRQVLRPHGLFIEGDDLDTITDVYQVLSKGPLVTADQVTEAQSPEGVGFREDGDPWPYDSFVGDMEQDEASRRARKQRFYLTTRFRVTDVSG